MFLMDRFFDGAFLTFGLEVIAFAEQDQEDRLDPLIYVFPRMTKVPFLDIVRFVATLLKGRSVVFSE